MSPTACPKCGSPLAPGSGEGRLACAGCGSQFTLRRGASPSVDPTRPMKSVPAAAPAAASPAPASGAPGSEGASGDGGVRRIGPYDVVQVLGRGGMGVVYKARDAALERWVAVKTLLPSLSNDPEARERFLREARAAAALSHPNLAQIYSIGEEGGTPHFAMELIEGQTLAQKIHQEGRLKPLEAIRLARQVALGLQEAQRFQLIHRDIKPANLILAPDGTVKITDFGLAKRAEGPAAMHLTTTGQAIGSPLYMSPEQARGAQVDHRSDMYSLGATLFHMLAGRPPFQAASPMDVVMKHIQEPAPSPRSFAPEVSYPLAGLVQRLLRKRPEDRFPNYRALIEELDRLEAAEQGGATVPQPVPVWVQERRGRSFGSLVGFVALCTAAGLIGFRIIRGALRGSGLVERGMEVEKAGGAERPAHREPARVDAAPGPDLPRGAAEARPPASPEAARLRVIGLTRDPLPPSGLRVRGHVLNEGAGPARGVRVVVRAYDEGGGLLASEATAPPRDPIGLGESVPFEVTLSPADRAARVEAEVTWIEEGS